MTEQPTHEDVIRLEGALHLMRFALDRLIKAEHKPAPEYLRDLLDRVTDDPGEPCDRDAQYARADRAEAALDRVRALHQPQHDGSGFPDSQQCSTCSQDGGDGYQYLVPWPCPTIRALDGEQPAPVPAATQATDDEHLGGHPAQPGAPRCTATWQIPDTGQLARCWRPADHNTSPGYETHMGETEQGSRHQWIGTEPGAVPHRDAIDQPKEQPVQQEKHTPVDWKALAEQNERRWKDEGNRRATAEAERDGAYRERARLVALVAGGLAEQVVVAPASDVDEPGWQILYATLHGRQCSWHFSPQDADLIEYFDHVPADDPRAQWDGHTTEVKYQHIDYLARALGTPGPFRDR